MANSSAKPPSIKLLRTECEPPLPPDLSYPSHLVADKAGNLFVADYDDGIIYEYKPDRIASHLCLRVASPCRYGHLIVRAICLWPITASGNIHQGSIYKYEPNGSRTYLCRIKPVRSPGRPGLRRHGQSAYGGFGRQHLQIRSRSSTSAPSNDLWLRPEQRAKPWHATPRATCLWWMRAM